MLMDAKKLFKNQSICSLPWTGFELEPNGVVKNCIISKAGIGNVNDTHIKDIMLGDKNTKLKKQMLDDSQPSNCSGCYLQEKDRNAISSISSRLYYHKEIAAKTKMSLYDDVKNFELKHVDLRWTNACNQACVYCGPTYSSKWEQELGRPVKSNREAKQEVKDYVFENIGQLENVYLAGGEPMLMKENVEFLRLLKDKNPNCTVRVNTNLSTTATGIFDLLCSFKNLHWTVSVETIEQEYEYIRHHGSWKDFCENLRTIKSLDHKISFNMLHFILNYKSVHKCIDYLKGEGFHDNSFVLGPLYKPKYFNNLNLPKKMLDEVVATLRSKLSQGAHGYLKNSYENLIAYYTSTPFKKDIKNFHDKINEMDARRGLDSKSTFDYLFEELHANTM